MLQEDVHLCILHLTHIINSALVIRLFNNANKIATNQENHIKKQKCRTNMKASLQREKVSNIFFNDQVDD